MVEGAPARAPRRRAPNRRRAPGSCPSAPPTPGAGPAPSPRRARGARWRCPPRPPQPGRTRLGGDGVEAARQGRRRVVRQHERHAPTRPSSRGVGNPSPSRHRRVADVGSGRSSPAAGPTGARARSPTSRMYRGSIPSRPRAPSTRPRTWPPARPLLGASWSRRAEYRRCHAYQLRPAVTPSQGEVVPGQVVRPPRLVGVDGPVVAQRRVAAGRGSGGGRPDARTARRRARRTPRPAPGSRSRSPRTRRTARGREARPTRPRPATPGWPPTS